ncbi:MAG: mechanosensitive ion channel family protein [Cellulosilyticaceae bacterium]
MFNTILHIDFAYQFYVKLAVAFLIFITFILLRKFINKFVLQFLRKRTNKFGELLDEMTLLLERPLSYMWLLLGGYFTLLVSPIIRLTNTTQPPLVIGDLEIELAIIPIHLLNQAMTILFIIGLIWLAYCFVDIYENLLIRIGSKFTLLDNALLIRFTSKLFKVIVMVIGVGMIIAQFTNLGDLLTGFGIAGAAITLIAKDTLTNVMSGIVLMIDTPFTIGDWIAVDSLEGIVEDVSFRSTRIRTFEQGLVIVPNSTLANDNILNWSTMPKRRRRMSLGVTYSTSEESLKAFIDSVYEQLLNISAIENDTLLVYFDNYGDFSLNIIIQYFTPNVDLKGYSSVVQDVNFQLMSIAKMHNIEIAFPTQTLHIKPEGIND